MCIRRQNLHVRRSLFEYIYICMYLYIIKETNIYHFQNQKIMTNAQIEKIAIYESKDSEKVIAFASTGFGMSDAWWATTHKLQYNGMLHGVYKTPSGLRRTVR